MEPTAKQIRCFYRLYRELYGEAPDTLYRGLKACLGGSSAAYTAAHDRYRLSRVLSRMETEAEAWTIDPQPSLSTVATDSLISELCRRGISVEQELAEDGAFRDTEGQPS